MGGGGGWGCGGELGDWGLAHCGLVTGEEKLVCLVKTTSSENSGHILFSVQILFDLFGGFDFHADLKLFT